VQVHHITPGRSDKNIGKALNQMIENLPDDDWICYRDIDTMPLHHRVFFGQCEAIAESGEYDLIGCMTNRLSVQYQLHGGEMSNDYNIENHVKIAEDRYYKYGNKVHDCPDIIAGIMMLFSKKVWLESGKFKEGGVQVNGTFFDYLFSKQVKAVGGRLGIAQGIYLFHLYRPWVVEAYNKRVRTEYQHLIN